MLHSDFFFTDQYSAFQCLPHLFLKNLLLMPLMSPLEGFGNVFFSAAWSAVGNCTQGSAGWLDKVLLLQSRWPDGAQSPEPHIKVDSTRFVSSLHITYTHTVTPPTHTRTRTHTVTHMPPFTHYIQTPRMIIFFN